MEIDRTNILIIFNRSQINQEGKNIPELPFSNPSRRNRPQNNVSCYAGHGDRSNAISDWSTPTRPHGYWPPCNALLTQWGGGGSMY
jgi:hypothetical protein